MRIITPILSIYIALQGLAGTAFAEIPFEDSEPPTEIPENILKSYREGRTALKQLRTTAKNFYTNADKAKTSFEAAVKASRFGAGVPPQARKRFQELAKYNLGIAYQMTMEFKKAEQTLRSLVLPSPKHYQAMVELGDVYAWQKDYRNALVWYDKALKIRADYFNALFSRGLIQMKQRKYEPAKADLTQALALAERNAAQSGTEEKSHWEKRQGALKKMLELIEKDGHGAPWPKTFTRQTRHYLIQTDISQDLCDQIAAEAEKIFSVYATAFGSEPRESRFPVLVFGNDQDYFKFGGRPRTGGYYNPFVKKLVIRGKPKMRDNFITLHHEGFHQFLDYYLERPPQWFNEGFGDYFGPSEVLAGPRGGLKPNPNPWRLPLIRTAVARGMVKPFKEITMLVQAELYDPKTIAVNYAQAWSMIYFLMMAKPESNFPYRLILRNYYQALRQGQGVQTAYQSSFGRTNVQQLEKEWKQFILTLRPENLASR